MDPGLERSAHELVNEAEPRHLETIFRDLGEERYARQIARAIVRARGRKPIASTIELVDVITQAIPTPARFAGGHPAKRVFQALRIAVNDELGQLDAALPLAWALLRDARPPRRDLLSLARGPARQALPRRARAGLHLPAGPAGLRLRARARGRARQPPLDRADARRDRRKPACALGAPAGRHRRSGRIKDEPPQQRAQTAHDRPAGCRGACRARPRRRAKAPRRAQRQQRAAARAARAHRRRRAGLRRARRRAAPAPRAARPAAGPPPGGARSRTCARRASPTAASRSPSAAPASRSTSRPAARWTASCAAACGSASSPSA